MAFNQLAKLVVSLEAETKRYQEKLDQANKTLSRFESRQKSSVAAIKSALIGLGAAFSIRAVTGFVNNQIRAADALLDTTKRIGGTVEALAELQHAANLSGVDVNTLTMGLQTMTKNISEASQGTGRAVKSLNELGVSAVYLSKLSVDKQFEALAEALSGVTNESDRTRIAIKLFGAEGAALLQIMEGGAAGVRALRQEAIDLGRLTTEQAEAAAEAADALDRFKASADSLARNLTVGLLPAINAVVVGWNRIIFGADPFPFEAAINETEDSLKGLRRQFDEWTAAVNEPGRAAEIERLTGLISVQEAKLKALVNSQKEALGLVAPVSADVASMDFWTSSIANADAAMAAATTKQAKDISELYEKLVVEYETAEQQVARKMDQFDLVAHLFPPEDQKRIRDVIASHLTEGIEEIEVNAQKRVKARSDELDSIREFLKSQEEIEAEAYKRRQDIILANMDAGAERDALLLENAQQRAEAIIQLERDTQAQITQAIIDGTLTREQVEKASMQTKVKGTLGSLKAMTAGVALQSRKMFELNKAAAIADALLGAKEAILGAYKVGAKLGGPVLGAAFAATAAAATAAQVAAIKSASFGGGTTPSFAGSVPTFEGQPIPQNQPNEPQEQIIEVHVYGNGVLLQDQLIKVIRDATDRDEIIFAQNSRQARRGGG